MLLCICINCTKGRRLLFFFILICISVIMYRMCVSHFGRSIQVRFFLCCWLFQTFSSFLFLFVCLFLPHLCNIHFSFPFEIQLTNLVFTRISGSSKHSAKRPRIESINSLRMKTRNRKRNFNFDLVEQEPNKSNILYQRCPRMFSIRTIENVLILSLLLLIQ